MFTQKKTDILIVHLNGEIVIDECLSSIFKDNKSASVYVLFNNSEDNSAKIVMNKFPTVKRYFSKKTIGFAEASNFLAKKASSDYIVFLNNDVIVGKNWLKELKKTMEKNKNCVACQSKIRSYHRKQYFDYAGAAGGFIDKYGFPFCRGRIFNAIERDEGQYDDERRIFWGCGVCLLVDRKFFLKVGGFDETLFMYAEELDFCWRANLAGKEIYYSPKSVIHHIGNFSIGKQKVNHKKEYLITRNHLLVLLKNYSTISLIKTLPTRIFLEIIAALRFPEKKAIPLITSIFSVPYIYFTDTRKKRVQIQKNRKTTDKVISKLMLHRSIAFEHYIRGINKFSELPFR